MYSLERMDGLPHLAIDLFFTHYLPCKYLFIFTI